MRMQEAYRAAFYDQLLENTARAVEQGVVDRVRERGVRPTENGIHSRGAVATGPDVGRMSRPAGSHRAGSAARRQDPAVKQVRTGPKGRHTYRKERKKQDEMERNSL